MSEEKVKPLIHQRILKVMQNMPAVGKDGYHKDQKYRFRSIDAICTVVHDLMREHGIYFIPQMLDSNVAIVDRIDKNTGKVFGRYTHTTIKVKYTFYCGDDGSTLEVGPVPGESIDYGDKGYPKAMTFAMKTMLLEVFCIPVQNQLDPDMGGGEGENDPVDDVIGDTDGPRKPTKIENEVMECIIKRLRCDTDDDISKDKLAVELWRLKGTYPNDPEKDVDRCVRYFIQPKNLSLITNKGAA